MTLVVGILLIMFGLDPSTGKLKIKKKEKKAKKIDPKKLDVLEDWTVKQVKKHDKNDK